MGRIAIKTLLFVLRYPRFITWTVVWITVVGTYQGIHTF